MKAAGRAFPLLFLLPAAFCLGQLWLPRASVYAGSRPTVGALVAALSKLLLLALSAYFSHRNARALANADDHVSEAWSRLAMGWMMYFLGQLCLGWYQLRGLEAPYPSLGDAFFLGAYPFFIPSLVGFIRAYRSAGFALGTNRQQAVLGGAVGAVCLAVALPLLKPALLAPTPAVETALNLAYPVLDLALVVPVALLVRMVFAFRGGAVAWVWASLLAGFAFLSAGDVLFAHFSALGRVGLDPYVHATYILAYGLVADGARRQLALLTA
jgi:hypothetical protein